MDDCSRCCGPVFAREDEEDTLEPPEDDDHYSEQGDDMTPLGYSAIQLAQVHGLWGYTPYYAL